MSKKEMTTYDEEIESTNKSSEEEIQSIPPEVKEDKETEESKETKEDKETEKNKEKVVSEKTKASKSPGTPRKNMAKLMGAARMPFGLFLKPTTSDDASQQRISGGSGSANKGVTEMVPLNSPVSEKARPSSVEKARPSLVEMVSSVTCFGAPKSARPSSVDKTPPDGKALASSKSAGPSSADKIRPDARDVPDENASSDAPDVPDENASSDAPDVPDVTAEDGVLEEPSLETVIAQLKDAVVRLTDAINTKFAKDPLEALYKEREELTKFVLAIGGLTTVASFSSPPGGLDANGYIRFRDTTCYFVYLLLSNAGFMVTYMNLAQLHKPVEEPVEEQASKAETLRRRLDIGWVLLWFVIAAFFGTFTAGFWLVYPGKEAEGSSVHSIWPRWFVLGMSISKVVGGLLCVFGRKLVSCCF